MQRDYAKCGKDAFEISIVEIIGLRGDLIPREQFWLDEIKPEYNNAKVAASVVGVRHSAEVVQKKQGAKRRVWKWECSHYGEPSQAN